MDTTTNDITAATAVVFQEAFSKLRDAFPFMRPEDLQTAVERATAQLQHDLRLLEPGSTTRKTRFDFNKLPAEMRIYIYELALARDDSDPFQTQHSSAYAPVDTVLPTPFPAVLHINRQIRQEALPIFYKQSTFAATFNYYSKVEPGQAVHNCLDLIGPSLGSLIQRLDVRFLEMVDAEVEDFIDTAERQSKLPLPIRGIMGGNCASARSLRP